MMMVASVMMSGFVIMTEFIETEGSLAIIETLQALLLVWAMTGETKMAGYMDFADSAFCAAACHGASIKVNFLKLV